MKNLSENFAILLVGVFSLLIIFLILQYNMIGDEVVEEIVFTSPVKTKESTGNSVAVQSEISSDEVGSAITDKSKSSYMENLENDVKPEAPKTPEDPGKLPEDEIEDEIGMAIDVALDNL